MHLNVVPSISKLDTLAGRIGAVIAARYTSIKDTSARIGMSRTSVSQWVGGHKTPGIETLGRFADVSEVSLAWLVDGTGPAPDLTPLRRGKRMPVGQAEAKPTVLSSTRPVGGVKAFAALSLTTGIALESIRHARAEVMTWIDHENAAAGGQTEWIVAPIEIRLTPG
jgi:transcriptional regulator with XRE-family HTH domain